MFCKACNRIPNCEQNEDCFDMALDVLKKHYTFFKTALHQRDLELQKVKERNEKLNKALKLLQTKQQPTKRFKSQGSDESWLANISSQDERITSGHSLTDDEQLGANNLNMALNSEQLFDTSLSQNINDDSRSSTEIMAIQRLKESPKRNKQHDLKRCLKDRNNTGLPRSKSEWHGKERNDSLVEKSWAMKFVQPVKLKKSEEKVGDSSKNPPLDKKSLLSLKKPNPSKVKQSLLHFTKSKEGSSREPEVEEDIIEASPVVNVNNPKAARTWTHRSLQNCSKLANEPTKSGDISNTTLDDIVFDFSPSKKTESLPNGQSPELIEPKSLKFNNENYMDCVALPNDNHLVISSQKSDTSSVVILTPGTQDIIFVEDDTCNIGPEIDTLDLLADNLDKLKKYESKCLVKQQNNKDLEATKKLPTNAITVNQTLFKPEKITQENLKTDADKEEKPCSSKSKSNLLPPKHKNPLLSSDEHDTEDEEFMPKPFLIKQEPLSAKVDKKLSIKKRFNIDCEDCEKLIDFLGGKLTDAQIQQHLDKCTHHKNPNHMLTPTGFWNPFILSFQPDDPRNEVLIDNRFKENKNN